MRMIHEIQDQRDIHGQMENLAFALDAKIIFANLWKNVRH
jgi:hypothetical protein